MIFMAKIDLMLPIYMLGDGGNNLWFLFIFTLFRVLRDEGPELLTDRNFRSEPKNIARTRPESEFDLRP